MEEKIIEIIRRSLHNDFTSSSRVSDDALAEYVYHLFEDAIEFHKLNNVYFDEETLSDIKKLFMKELDKIVDSQEVEDEVSSHIDAYIQSYVIEGEPKKAMFEEIDDLYYSCIDLIKEASKNVKENTCKKTIDDYINKFDNRIDKLYDLELIYHADFPGADMGLVFVYDIMFQTILKCYFDGGDFKMIQELHTKLEEDFEGYLE